MGDLAVVALEVVLAADLPVRVVLGLGATDEPQRVHVDAPLGEEVRKRAEHVGKRWRLRVRVDEDKGAPGGDRQWQQSHSLRLETRLAVGSRRRAQHPVEVVRPRVVRALQRLATALAFADERASVAAHVEERAELAVVAAHDEHGDVAGACCDEARGLRDLVGARDVLPAAAEDAFLLGGQHRRVDVPAPREGLRRHRGFHAASVVGHTER